MVYIIERLIIVLLTLFVFIAGAVQERMLPKPTTAVVTMMTDAEEPTPETVSETETPETAPQCTTVPQTAQQWQDGFVQYSIAGNEPPYEWEWYLYGQLADRGVEWFYPYAICQIWQESRWNASSTNGRDHGLCQQKGIYWEGRAQAAGIPGADIWDPYAQLYVYSWMMSGYLAAAGGNVGRALSMYYLGADAWSDEYIGHVMRWMDYLEVVK